MKRRPCSRAPPWARSRARDGRAPAKQRAQQTIPPASRRAVLTRDQRRCRVPGCRNATFLHVHHLELRSEGGRHSAENLLTVCGLHHRALHRGKLVVEGSSATAAFRHADGSDYGHALQPRALDAASKVFRGYETSDFARAKSVRCSASCARTTSFETPAPKRCCARHWLGCERRERRFDRIGAIPCRSAWCQGSGLP